MENSRKTMPWKIQDSVFDDGSTLKDWKLLESYPYKKKQGAAEWFFDIYLYKDNYWKLYKCRIEVEKGDYVYTYGGQACRMSKVEYLENAISPHSHLLFKKGNEEWVRVSEVDEDIHKTLVKGIDG
ncbi:MAG: hypothetical protein AAF717_20575 [Bacteroidota bacterium]